MTAPFDFGSGEIGYCSWAIDPARPLTEQRTELREDLIQVQFRNQDLILDIGWRPEGNPEGHFIVEIVKGRAWESPVWRCEAFTVSELDSCVRKAMNVVRFGIL